MLPARRLTSFVGTALRSRRGPIAFPPGFDARVTAGILAMRRRVSGLRLDQVTVDGFTIPFLTGGPANPRGDVVLIHGFSDTKDTFVDTARALVKTHRVFLPDLPGFSDASQPWDFHYNLPAMAAVVARAVQAMGLSRAHLVGNSLGGAVAAQIALTEPERVDSLTLICAAGVAMPTPSPLQHRINAGENPFVVDTYDDWWKFIELALERRPVIPGVVRRTMARTFIGRAAMNGKILEDLLRADFDLTDALPQMRAPTLALWGDCDRLVDLSAGRVFHDKIPDARLVILHGVGHCPQAESPGRTAVLVRRHIERATV